MLAALLFVASMPKGPMEFGRAEVAKVAGARASDVDIVVKAGGPKESFSIEGDGRKVRITGSDPTGAMYGAFEFAERLHQKGESAWSTDLRQQPYLAERGLNLFLTLPWDYKKNDTDYDVAALTDPNRWWFANEDYWTTLLDLMAKSRLNWLDIHGGWDISVTNAPNLYAYFVTSRTFPLVGVPQAVKDKNLAQLNHVIEIAHARGIRVSLMCYEANLKIPQNPNPPYKADEKNIYKYTKEVVEQIIRKAPGLDAIGFRIGESGRSESFFKCYGEAVKASGRDIPLITRSWITRKQKVLPLARASKDFTVEIKYNGEQWGAPYMVAGGRMANWGSYSFEDYLSDSGDAGASRPRSWSGAKLWPGNPVETNAGQTGGRAGSAGQSADETAHSKERWPDEPYKIVWQVRANGTHRIFPFYNPEWVRRSIKCMKIGTASGYTVEGEDAYYPKSPDYYLAHPEKDKFCNWIHQRDEMYWMTWGRLGYDPTMPDEVFDARATELLGSGSGPLVKAWKEASEAISKSYMAYALGPDHRDHAPELEWGGDTDAFIHGQPFDSLVVTPLDEKQANYMSGGIDFRIDGATLAYPGYHPPSEFHASTPRAQALVEAVALMRARADYVSDRLASATTMADIFSQNGGPAADGWAKQLLDRSTREHRVLADAKGLKAFTEKLRMHTNSFTWAGEQPKIEAEAKRVAALPGYQRGPGQVAGPFNLIKDCRLTWKPEGEHIVCRVDGPSILRASLLVKPLPSSTFFHEIKMQPAGGGYEARVERPRYGLAIASEVEQRIAPADALKGGGPSMRARIPDVEKATPYLVIPAQPGLTPQIYSSEEAMTYLDPKVLSPNKFGAILIGTRANNFFQRFNRATKRKLLGPVERGMKLVILQEDFGKDKLDFLPKPLKFEGFQANTFDPGGQLDLKKVDVVGIMWQRFLPSEGWEVFGNGGLARIKLGKGEVWVTTARLMQNMQYPGAAKAFVQMLSLGGKVKPTVIVDACSEGGPFTSSCHQDLMNSHDIPFLTLGEVIAKEQGMNSFTAIPGPVMNDDVLEGKGAAMANKFLRDQVVALSKRPTPASVSAFEKERKRRKAELLRSLGLDPMPAKTPLNARVTGVIQGNGYHIEKVVFESRSKFYVTAHVYVPEGAHPRGWKFPVIVNVNGHWAHKKDEDRIQLRCAFQALQGYIAIAIDSPGHSFEGNSLIERRAEGDHNDWFLVEGGTNATGYYVWDAIRALDYMATRPDTDMKRVGLTGASGGGLATLYAFAADDRYTAAVPVVYMSSMELAPDNGCLCNHVPGTCQVGDRSDVLAIQAPKPVFIFGAQNDGEFPPDAMRLTQKKAAETWKLFGKADDIFVRIFDGPHDYNQLMREQMIGFFNRYVRDAPSPQLRRPSPPEGRGVPAPVRQPALHAIDPEDHQLLVLDPPTPGERTMRDLSLEYLANAPAEVPVEQAIAVNGGQPKKAPLNWKESNQSITFESEPGLITPGVLVKPNAGIKGVRIHISDQGKAAALSSTGVTPAKDDVADLYIDALGTGELSGIELRYPIYAGRSVAFTAGWQIVRAADAMRKYAPRIEVVADGPMSTQAAMWAGLLDPSIAKIDCTNCLGTWSDTFKDGVDPIAVQPRAHLCGSLENLRKHVKNATWKTSR